MCIWHGKGKMMDVEITKPVVGYKVLSKHGDRYYSPLQGAIWEGDKCHARSGRHVADYNFGVYMFKSWLAARMYRIGMADPDEVVKVEGWGVVKEFGYEFPAQGGGFICEHARVVR